MKLSRASTIFFLVSLLALSPFAPVSAQTSYTNERSVIACGGAPGSSSNHTLQSTLGQSTPVGISRSARNANSAGFWTEPAKRRVVVAPLVPLLLKR